MPFIGFTSALFITIFVAIAFVPVALVIDWARREKDPEPESLAPPSENRLPHRYQRRQR